MKCLAVPTRRRGKNRLCSRSLLSWGQGSPMGSLSPSPANSGKFKVNEYGKQWIWRSFSFKVFVKHPLQLCNQEPALCIPLVSTLSPLRLVLCPSSSAWCHKRTDSYSTYPSTRLPSYLFWISIKKLSIPCPDLHSLPPAPSQTVVLVPCLWSLCCPRSNWINFFSLWAPAPMGVLSWFLQPCDGDSFFSLLFYFPFSSSSAYVN